MGAEGAIVASDPRRARVFRVAMTTRGPRVGVAATRGVSANDPRPPASSANAARACLEHLCECLRALGVGTAGASRDPTALTAETLRRAKFDQPSSVAPLWRALHDLFLVAHAGFPEPSVAAETLRVLRDETADRFQSDEKSDLDDQDAFLDDANEKEHARVARRFLRLAKYPRMHELLHRDEHDRDDDDSSRALLVALAWATCEMDVHARAHADRNAAAFGMFLTNDENVSKTLVNEKGAFSKGIRIGSSSLLPPYGSDAAASPASAELNAASAVAAERAYLRDAAERARKKSARGGKLHSASSAPSSAFVEKQAACLAQRVWQSVSHVHALERARAARRIAVHDAQTSATDGRGASPRRAMTATEIRLAKDKDARGRCMAAMRAVLVTKDAASETVALAETFWAWMRSVLELDEKEKTARAKDAKDAKKKKAEESKRSSSSRRGDVTDANENDTSNDSLEHLSSRLRDLELAARRVGPNLRSRRRDVETVARTWRRTREATRADLKQSAALSSLATAAAARTPSIASFEAGARRKMKEDGDACVERFSTSKTKEVKTTRVMTSSSFGIGCFVVDDAPAPPGVAAALATRGGSFAANFSNVDDVDELETANASMGFVEKTNDGETKVAEPRFGSRLLASKRSVANAETCAEAAARLRVTLTESEALLHTQRARAADVLRREVTRAFGNGNGDGDATRARVAVHGW